MKIRIKSNSLRYRLTRSDVAQLISERHLEDKVNFGNRALVYALKLDADERLSASFSDDTITLCMSENMINELENTEKVGFEEDAGGLHLLVEKDFTCLDNVDEDQSDNYPNPLAAKIA
jgi:hypothetical protein